MPLRAERNKKQESLEVKSLTVDFLPMKERPSVKKLLAYKKK